MAARDEIAGSRDDLQVRLGRPPLAFAYPHGRASAREVRLVRDAGYRLAFTTEQGRNGVAADPYLLRRVSMKAWDTRLSFLWKLLTGEQPPPSWERWLLLRAAVGARLGRARPGAAAPARAPAPPDAAQRRRRAL